MIWFHSPIKKHFKNMFSKKIVNFQHERMKNIIVSILLKEEKVYFAQPNQFFVLRFLSWDDTASKIFPLYYEVVTIEIISYDQEIVFQFS